MLRMLAFLTALASVPAAQAQPYYGYPHRDVDATGSLGGRAPWNAPWEYDTGSDNDRRPDLPYYQQNRGTQTGGPARNLLPYDGFTIVPR